MERDRAPAARPRRAVGAQGGRRRADPGRRERIPRAISAGVGAGRRVAAADLPRDGRRRHPHLPRRPREVDVRAGRAGPLRVGSCAAHLPSGRELMGSAVLGLLGAFVYGSADFLGGVAARRIGPLRTTAVGAAPGPVLLLLPVSLVGGSWSAAALGWGALSGLAGAVAIALLYGCLAIGPMSILSPLTALVSAFVPGALGLFGGDRFQPIGYLALGLALVAVVLVG